MVKRILRKLKNNYIKRKISKNEKEFRYNDQVVKYCYIPYRGSDVLAVVFSGFPAEGKPATYNMVATFEGVPVNRLYILDNFGYGERGAYYLGENGDFAVRDAVLALLKEFSFQTRVFLGSSKGGTAAVMFGLLSGSDRIIAGAPQLYLGDYLTSQVAHIPVLDAMAGDHAAATVERYNRIIPEVIQTVPETDITKILLHYSPKEHTYHTHIAEMIAMLESRGFAVEHDVQSYLNHGDVAKFFPALCRRELKKLAAHSKAQR